MYYENKQVSSDTEPLRVEITPTAVFTRTDVQERNDTLEDGKERKYYVYRETKKAVPKHIADLTKDNEVLTESTATLGQTLAEERFNGVQKDHLIGELGQTLAKIRFEVITLDSAVKALTKGGEA